MKNEKHDIPRDYYSLPEAAARTGLTVKGLRGLIYAGHLPAVKFGRLVRIPAEALKPENLPAVVAPKGYNV